MIRSADSAEKEQATDRLRTPLIVMGHGQPFQSSRQFKTIGRPTFHTHIGLKQAASQGLGLDCSSIHLPPCGRNKQLIQVGTTKTTGGDLTTRQLQPFKQLTAKWIPARHASTAKQGNPKHSLGIDAHAIWKGIPRFWDLETNRGFSSDLTGAGEREGHHIQRWRINEIERPTVLAPGQSVGNGELAALARDPSITIQTPKSSRQRLKVIGHRAGPKAPPRVAFAVVEAISRTIGLWIRQQGHRFAARIQPHQPCRCC